MHAIDQTIARVEQLYTTLTGQRPPRPSNSAPIPPESDPVAYVEEQLGRLMSSLEQVVPTSATTAPAWSPRAISWRDATGISIAIDIPGVPREQVQIRVEPWTITVTGQRQPPWLRAQARAVDGTEVPLGTFARSFRIDMPAGPDQVSARLDDGVLTIRIATSTRSEPSQIPIGS